MNTLQIEHFLSKHLKTKSIFIGVFPSDRLPKTIFKYPALIIANTDTSDQPGTHWIAFYFDSRRSAEFFDSCDQYTQKKEFLKFLKSNAYKFFFNKQQLQGYFSNTCGHYCMMYGLFKSKKKTLNFFLSEFKKNDYFFNDNFIIKMFKNHFKK